MDGIASASSKCSAYSRASPTVTASRLYRRHTALPRLRAAGGDALCGARRRASASRRDRGAPSAHGVYAMTMRAMILAAGRGERMRPLTDATPKPLLEAGGKPLIAWTIEALVRAQVSDIVITSRTRRSIVSALGAADVESSVSAFRTKPRRSRRPAASRMRCPSSARAFYRRNGDIHTDFDFATLAPPGERHGALVLIDNPTHHREGDFVLNTPAAWRMTAHRSSHSAVSALPPSLFSHIPAGTRAHARVGSEAADR